VTPPALGLPDPRRRRREAALRSRAARGDAAAFALVYERHQQALYRYCRSIVGHDEDARDALQSAMARAFAALVDEERDFDLRPWLFRIVHNEAVSLVRRRREAGGLEEADAASPHSLEHAVETRVRLAQLRADLAELPERQRAALVLRELSGLSHVEIAEVVGGTPRSVKQVIFEARSALEDLREGRGLACEAVCRAISDGDGRILRGRRMRAHLRVCGACAGFKASLERRPGELAALVPPVPLLAAGALAAQLLPGAGHAAGVGVGAAGTGASVTASGGGIAGALTAAGGKIALVAVGAGLAAGGAVAAPSVVAPGGHDGATARAVTAPRPAARPSPVVTAAPAAPAAPAVRRIAVRDRDEALPVRSTRALGRAKAPDASRPAAAAVPGPTRSAPAARRARSPAARSGPEPGHGRPATSPSATHRPSHLPGRPTRPAKPKVPARAPATKPSTPKPAAAPATPKPAPATAPANVPAAPSSSAGPPATTPGQGRPPAAGDPPGQAETTPPTSP
jgi:RNA polymerase sigma factor (sigma-70 family)